MTPTTAATTSAAAIRRAARRTPPWSPIPAPRSRTTSGKRHAHCEQLAKCRGVGFELLVTGDLQLQCAEALGTRVGLAEHA